MDIGPKNYPMLAGIRCSELHTKCVCLLAVAEPLSFYRPRFERNPVTSLRPSTRSRNNGARPTGCNGSLVSVEAGSRRSGGLSLGRAARREACDRFGFRVEDLEHR